MDKKRGSWADASEDEEDEVVAAAEEAAEAVVAATSAVAISKLPVCKCHTFTQ